MSAALLLALAVSVQEPVADGFAALAEQVQERTLENGLRVLVLPRGEAPVASFRVYVRAGAIDEDAGLTGLAHFAEHMAFKGSRRIGSRDWEAELAAMERCDTAWAAYEQAATGRLVADPDEVANLRAAFEQAREAANAFSDASAFDRAVEEAGGLDQNATTGADATQYFVSLPAERLEHWFWLTREQIGAPVMREFYREREVVMEERRMRTESSPVGALYEALLQTAFVAHPYRDSTIGHMDDLRWLDRPEMNDFWARHYGARRIVVAVVGRVDAGQVFEYAETYLGDLPPGDVRPRRTSEPIQSGSRRISVVRPAAPRAMLAWHVPPLIGREGLVYDALADLLADNNASRLVRQLVFEEGAAARISAFAGFPGRVDPTLFVVHAMPVPDQDLDDLVARVQHEIDRFADEGPTARELEGMRRRLKVSLLASLETDAGMARALAHAEAEEGGWRSLFEQLARLDELDAGDLQAAAAGLRAEQRTTAVLRPPREDAE